jgi:hypothetical protein
MQVEHTVSVWEAEGRFCLARIRVDRKTPFGDQGITGSIGRIKLDLVFGAWERILSKCIQMKDESIA